MALTKYNIPQQGNWEDLNQLINYNFNLTGIEATRYSGSPTGKYKGLFQTLQELQLSDPDPQPGDYASVFVSSTLKIYAVNNDRVWTEIATQTTTVETGMNEHAEELTNISEWLSHYNN